MTGFRAGDRVALTQDVDRYPHFIARAGSVGTVTHVESHRSAERLAVHMDEPLPGSEEWGNSVEWYDLAEARVDLEVVARQ